MYGRVEHACPVLQHALVAVSGIMTHATVLWATVGLRHEMEEGGIDAEDIWCFPGQLPKPGLWVWEGKVVLVKIEYPDIDFDTDFEGEFRKPTPEEWAKIQNNEQPWEDDPEELIALGYVDETESDNQGGSNV